MEQNFYSAMFFLVQELIVCFNWKIKFFRLIWARTWTDVIKSRNAYPQFRLQKSENTELFCNCPLLKYIRFITNACCLVRAIFGINHPRDFLKKSQRAISKNSKIHSSNLSQIVLPNIWLSVQTVLELPSVIPCKYNRKTVNYKFLASYKKSTILAKIFQTNCTFSVK